MIHNMHMEVAVDCTLHVTGHNATGLLKRVPEASLVRSLVGEHVNMYFVLTMHHLLTTCRDMLTYRWWWLIKNLLDLSHNVVVG